MCRDCELFDTCDYHKQKTMNVIETIILVSSDLESGVGYPYPGGSLNQPLWLIHFHNVAMKEKIRIRKEIAKRSQNAQ
jgi:hypothetical protein